MYTCTIPAQRVKGTILAVTPIAAKGEFGGRSLIIIQPVITNSQINTKLLCYCVCNSARGKKDTVLLTIALQPKLLVTDKRNV